MKILHVVPTYLPAWRYGGPIRSVHGLAKALVNRGHEVYVYTTNIDGPNVLDVPTNTPVNIDGILVYYFPCEVLLRRLYISKEMKIRALCDIEKFDVIHLHSIFLWPTWMISRLAIKNNIPYILSPRGMLINKLIKKKNLIIKKIWIYLFEEKTIANAKYIHFTTKLEHDEFVRLNFQSKLFLTIPNGYEFHEEFNYKTLDLNKLENFSPPYIIFVGRVNWKKGLDRLIQAMKFISDCQLLVVGNNDGMMEKLIDQVKNLDLKNRVHFIGEVDGEEKNDLIRKSKMLVLPSYSENFGNVLLEAMALGIPVAVTKDVGLVDDILAHMTGVLLPDDPVGMGNKLAETLRNEELLNKMGKAGYQFSKNFSWDSIAIKFEKAYLIK
jgi:glycosyltransferase involved in cell wall biosynthesis